jgi:hypothetical protein
MDLLCYPRSHKQSLLFTDSDYPGCFKKSLTALKAYVNLFRVHVQCFELS